jgi:hypothetical protein
LMATSLKPYSSSAHCTASMLSAMYTAPSLSRCVGPGSCPMQWCSYTCAGVVGPSHPEHGARLSHEHGRRCSPLVAAVSPSRKEVRCLCRAVCCGISSCNSDACTKFCKPSEE